MEGIIEFTVNFQDQPKKIKVLNGGSKRTDVEIYIGDIMIHTYSVANLGYLEVANNIKQGALRNKLTITN